MKQAESTIDQLGDHPLKGISTDHDHVIIVLVFTQNAHAQIKMRLPPVVPSWNSLIIEQSREWKTLDKIPVTQNQIEAFVPTSTVLMATDISTAAQSQQDLMIKSAETS